MTMMTEIPVVIKIMRARDRVIREYYATEYEHDGVWNSFIWTDGNYGCDCNRHLFFERAAGHEAINEDYDCSTGKYIVLAISRVDTGETLYCEERL